MSQSEPQIPKLGSEFSTVEKFKEAAQQGIKAAGFAFSVSLSKISHVEKDGHAPFVTLQCVMGEKYRNNYEITEETRKKVYKMSKLPLHWKDVIAYTKDIINECDRIKNALNKGSNYDTTMRLLKMLEEHQYIIRHQLAKDESMQNLFFTHIEAARQLFDSNENYNEFLLSVQKVAYSGEMNEVKKAFDEVKKTSAKTEGSHSRLKKAIEAASGLEQSIDIAVSKALYKLEEKYETLSDSGSKATLLQKIEALAIEENIIPKAPLQVISKGRPISTKRDLFLSECQDKIAATKEKNTKVSMSKLIKYSQIQQFLYHDQIPVYMHKFIKEVIDVDKDGNYGYRALAVSLERNENEWLEVRKELKNELNEREQFYQSLFLANDDYEIIKKEISWLDGSLNLTFLSYHQPLNQNRALAIGFVNNNHYVAIVLKPGAPIPPIVNRWLQFTTSAASR
ncbi:9715_t:CDS:2 [Dentiscutata erythropus]|uniref:9715_t:CDS:1 n=1 Tax=Dentiscutata erythropus TaxID=1348616 RepID=A0A9N8ZDC7_9GLOM|nr:9715_t:CDS:2 [Dentiscutata erythropus]